MAKRNGKPSMALMYPQTAGSAYAAWALCRSWGQLYTGTDGDPHAVFDRPMRAFEKKYARYYRDPDKRADAAFWFSPETRDYSDPDAPQKYMKPFMAYLEAAYVSGITCDMVFGTDEPSVLASFRTIVVPYVYAIRDEEAEKLRNRVETFRRETGTKGGIHLTFVTPYGVKRNKYWNLVQSEVTLDDLFADA